MLRAVLKEHESSETSRPPAERSSSRIWLSPSGAVALACWIYVIIRAVNVAIVHDESITYGILRGDPTFVNQANNHWLNTALMKLSRWAFGDSELALRLPNILAFPIYAASVMAILRIVRPAGRLVGVLIFFGNPFVLEFFGLARGYGLAMAACAAMVAGITVGDLRLRPLWRLMFVSATAVVMFYGSFSALNVALAGIGVQLVTMGVYRLYTLRISAWAALIVCCAGAAAVPGLRHVLEMQQAGLLYVGGSRGLIPDTVGSLIWCSQGWGRKPSWLAAGEALSLIHI